MKLWRFRPKNAPVITPIEAERIIKEKPEKANFSLGKHEDVEIQYEGSRLRFEYMGKEYELDLSSLEDIAKQPERRVFALNNSEVFHLAWSSEEAYYQLIAVHPRHAPTVEINGIHMHRIKGILPFYDAKQKVRRLRIRKGMKVLDICTGLGYTAIWERRFGGIVTTIEIDENILELAEWNPWSEELKDITIIHGDAFEVIREFEDSSFHRVLNDPPRFSFAGELYSREFFKEIYRVLKPRGVLFQYTGRARENIGKGIIKGVLSRLRDVGFIPRYDDSVQGVIAIKPGKR